MPNSYPLSAPMTTQPTITPGYRPPNSYAGGLMRRSPGFAGVRGLGHLTAVDQLVVHQKVKALELIGTEMNSEFSIKNKTGQEIYTAVEDTDSCTRSCLGTNRPFNMKVKDNSGIEVMNLYRDMVCGCCGADSQEMEVTASNGNRIGTIRKEWAVIAPTFAVQNTVGETVLYIESPICTLSAGRDVTFKILLPDGSTEIGKIHKQWSGFFQEACTRADNFMICFPVELDVILKALLLAACLLIDFAIFEK